jgi:IMP dehydrogenase
MRFLNDLRPNFDLTYSDVFLVPSYSDINSRFEVDLQPADNSGATLPIVVSNMNSVAGKRMSETIARRGGLTVLPQDIPPEVLRSTVEYIKSRDVVYETPLTLSPENTINDALNIIHKRAHQAIIIINDKNEPVGIFTEDDAIGHDRFALLGQVMTKKLVTVPAGQDPKKIFDLLHRNRVSVAPVVKNKKMVGVMTQKGAVRSSIYKPAVDNRGRLLTALAIGINGDIAAKANQALSLGVDILALDTAHGHQKKMVQAIKCVRQEMC